MKQETITNFGKENAQPKTKVSVHAENTTCAQSSSDLLKQVYESFELGLQERVNAYISTLVEDNKARLFDLVLSCEGITLEEDKKAEALNEYSELSSGFRYLISQVAKTKRDDNGLLVDNKKPDNVFAEIGNYWFTKNRADISIHNFVRAFKGARAYKEALLRSARVAKKQDEKRTRALAFLANLGILEPTDAMIESTLKNIK